MDGKVFKKDSPGKLVETTFVETFLQDGVVQARDVKGVAFLPNSLPPHLDKNEVVVELHTRIVAAERALSQLEGSARRLPKSRHSKP